MTIKTGLFETERDTYQLDGSFPALRPCRFCGGTHGYLTGPKAPHRDGVRCNDCNRLLGWLPPAFHGEGSDDFEVIE